MTPAEYRIRCRMAESCLPPAEYRTRLTALHDTMLEEIEGQALIIDSYCHLHKRDEALLRQALDMLTTMPVKHPDQIAPRDALVAKIEERLNGIC